MGEEEDPASLLRNEAGASVTVTRTFLEMAARPSRVSPLAGDLRLEELRNCPAWYFRTLYGAVGGTHEWVHWQRAPDAELLAYLAPSARRLTVAMRQGWPAGFFLLDGTETGTVELAYFGLVPEARGSGLATGLLGAAIEAAWAWPGIRRLVVDTCTLDHPRALALYRGAGFTPVKTDTETRVLSQPRMMSTATGDQTHA